MHTSLTEEKNEMFNLKKKLWCCVDGAVKH